MSYFYHPDEDSEFYEDEESTDPTGLGELMMVCNTPGCLMPGMHFACECYTLQDAEEWQREMEQAQ